ncbi:hypothetical protein L6164_036911 [Bauhinia variegata]|uniref:Uncharacterized protein n=1 Tax=Bauhinia variegata TaxID=167791 RepID=A0ACB9KIH3_BAUVA|nr:hypothetical protein L6164_036911 [Bauhinia variegata]
MSLFYCQSLVKLKKVDLGYCKELVELPDFSMASNLEEVELYCCSNLLRVHPSILSLHKLVRLNLSDCKALTSLKSSIHLSSLRYLSLGHCSRLKEFSVTSENMIDLNLASTAINELPSSIGSLNKLESLLLDGCKSLKNLPSNLANMKSLRSLRIHGCIQLDASNLHNLLDGLWSLQELLLEQCCNLFELPENISMLSSLRLLLLKETDVRSLPASIKHLTKLEKLDLSGCRRLRFLPELPSSIKEFYAYNCTSLETVEFTSEIAELVRENKIRIRFQNCVNLSQYSLKAVGVNAHFILKKTAYQHLSTIKEGKMLDCPLDVIYPGSKVPAWFEPRTTQASITIEIPFAQTSKIWGFIFCVVVGRFPSNDKNFIGCDCYLESKESERGQMSLWSSIYAYEFISDHVCLWFDDRFCLQAHAANDECTAYKPKLVFEFFAQTDNVSDRRGDITIKECGVCPVNASEYCDFIKEMELKLMLQPRANEIGVRNSNGRIDGKGTFLPKKEFKKLTFPLLSTGNWKNGTQGLKDIIS